MKTNTKPPEYDDGGSYRISGKKRVACYACGLRIASKKAIAKDPVTGQRFEVDICKECSKK